MIKLDSELSALKVIPVIVVENPEDIIPIGETLVSNGLPVAEITFRTSAAEKAIELLRATQPQMLIGAGTVLHRRDILAARQAGANFIVSPGLNINNVCFSQDQGIPFIPGVNNPSDIEAAIELGLTEVKFFPAEASGGPSMLKALSGPYHQMKFMPTGGIGLKNIRDYLALPNVMACGCSWMVEPQLIRDGNWDEIAVRVREIIEVVTHES